MDVETEQTAEQSIEPTHDEEREALIAAAREAGGAESVDVDAEAAAAGQPAVTTPETPAAPDPEERFAAILRAREAAHKQRTDGETYATMIKQQAQEEARRLVDEARAEAKRTADAELAELRSKFRSSPAATLRALAEDGNPQSIVDEVLREGTPEARAMAQLREEARIAREEAQHGKSAMKAIEEYRESVRKQQEEQHIAQVRDAFLSAHANPEKTPYLHARYEPEEVFQRANALCMEWQRDGLVLGKDFDQSDLAGYLEKQSRERLTKLPGLTPQQVGGVDGKRPPGQANGSRTLSAATGSERRTTPRPVAEMSPDEERKALMEEVAAARRANPGLTT